MMLDRFSELWAATYAPQFELDEAIVKRNVVHHPLSVYKLDWPDALAVMKTPPTIDGANRVVFNLSAFAFDSVRAGSKALTEAKSTAKMLGASQLVFGMDSDHVWPGVPVEHPVLFDVLTKSGFDFGGQVVDLERDLADYQPRDSGALAPEFRVTNRHDEGLLLDYFDREFPGRWKLDVMAQFREDPRRVFVWESDGTIEGHALIQNEPTNRPIGGAVWRRSLGENWGALGSIGVSAAKRGDGNGGRLLDGALLELSRRGCRQTIIDWTGIASFYEKYGFKVTRQYQYASLHLT